MMRPLWLLSLSLSLSLTLPACRQSAERRAPRSDGADAGNPKGQVRSSSPGVDRLAAGHDHTCAIFRSGALKCWGRNAHGQLATGDAVNRGDQPDQMGDRLSPIDLGGGGVTALAVAAGAAHTCALLSTRELKCWGANAAGQLGRGSTPPLYTLPSSGIELAGMPAAVTAGAEFTCALLAGGQVTCWGANAAGQLGLGDRRARAVPAPDAVDLGARAVTIAAGARHACALLENGSVKCWGAGGAGQLGGGTFEDEVRPKPVQLGSGTTVKALAAGGDQTCVLLDGGQVRCWGANASGQLGTGDGAGRASPPEAALALGKGRAAAALAVGGAFICALLHDRHVVCWGDNRVHQLGAWLGGPAYGDQPGEIGDALPGVALGDGRTATAVASGRRHACAVLDSGDVRCWGENVHGQLGAGNNTDHSLFLAATTVVDLGATEGLH
jgi:alpha-tubulin suppressor-like RCC1 family protein